VYTNVYRNKMPEKDQTTSISARVPLDLFVEIRQEINETGQTMTEFMKDAAEEKLSNVNEQMLDSEIKMLESKLEILKNKKGRVKEKKQDLKKIPEEEIPFLKETKELLFKSPEYTKGRIKLYQNRFNKHYRVSEQEFWDLLDKV